MKKFMLLLGLCLGILMLAGGCNSKKKPDETREDAAPTQAAPDGTGETDNAEDAQQIERITNTLVREDYNVDDYIKLGKYLGIEITVDRLTVSEEDVYLMMQKDMKANGAKLSEVTGRSVKKGDTVNIDYEGIKDGTAFEGGTDTGFDLLIGSGAFIPGFEDQIIGAKKGDKFDINITFPENYGNADLAGQPVIFKITVNKIQSYELTEEYLTANTEFTTIDAYKASCGDALRLQNEQAMEKDKDNKIYDAIVKDSEITSFPETLLNYYAEDLKVFYTNYAAAYGVDLATFLGASGISEDQFAADSKAYAESMATRELVMKAVIKAENITLSEEEFNQGIDEYVTQYGYESREALLEIAKEDILREDLLYNKAFDFIISKAIVL